MKKIIRLTESDLHQIVKQVLNETTIDREVLDNLSQYLYSKNPKYEKQKEIVMGAIKGDNNYKKWLTDKMAKIYNLTDGKASSILNTALANLGKELEVSNRLDMDNFHNLFRW